MFWNARSFAKAAIQFGATMLIGISSVPQVQSAERELHLMAYADQELVYEAGVGAVVSRGNFDVVTRIQAIDRKNAWVHVTVFTPSTRPVTVHEAAIEAVSAAGPLKMLRYADLMKKEKRKQFWENLATGLAAGANSYNAAQSGNYTQRGSFNGRVNSYGSGGYASSKVSGNYTAYGTDPVAAQMATARANAENRAMIANVSNAQLARTAAQSNSVLHTEIIEFGDSYGGAVQMALPKAIRGQGRAFEIIVTVDVESHLFVVHGDARPSHEMLQQLAERTAVPRSPELSLRLGYVAWSSGPIGANSIGDLRQQKERGRPTSASTCRAAA